MMNSMRWNSEEYPYLYETHLHTNQASACARCSGYDMAKAAHEMGYAGIFVTDHNWGGNTCVDRSLPWEEWVDLFAEGYLDAKRYADEQDDFTVFFGFEAGFNATEFLIYGITPEWMKMHPELKTADFPKLRQLVQETGGMVVHAHPFREEPYIPEIRLYPDLVDAVEGINATHSCHLSKGHNDPAFDERAIAYANQHQLPMTAGSDIHHTRLLGGGMAFRRRMNSDREFCEAIRTGEDYILTNGDAVFDKYGKWLSERSATE